MDAISEDKYGRDEGSGNKTNLSNSFTSKKSFEAGYLTSKNAKKGGDNTKKNVKAIKNFNYLIPHAKKVFNFLQHAIIQALICQHFDLEWHI